MDRDQLVSDIDMEMELMNYSKVLELWEQFEDKRLDFNRLDDKILCDAISISLIETDQVDQALLYINLRLDYMKSISGEDDRVENNYSSWNFYSVMKINILFENGTRLQQYKLLLQYKRYGGNKDEYLSVLETIENDYYDKKLKPKLYNLAYCLSIAVPAMLCLTVVFSNRITTSWYYYLAVLAGSLFVYLYLYKKDFLKRLVLKVFSKLV